MKNTAYWQESCFSDLDHNQQPVLSANSIKNLILGTSVFKVLRNKSGMGKFNRVKFWGHSLGCATAARLIAIQLKGFPGEEVFLTGLLHDVGKIILDEYFKEQDDQVLLEEKISDMQS